MNLTAEIRRQFNVFVFLSDAEMATKFRSVLSLEGYEAFVFTDYETVLDRVRESSPHLIVFDVEALMGTLSEFVEKVLGANEEISFLPLVQSGAAEALEPYREYNFVGMLPQGDAIEIRMKWAVDQACSELYLTYMNEQLTLEAEKQVAKIAKLEEDVSSADSPDSTQIIEVFSARDCAKAYVGANSKDDLIRIFFQRMSVSRGLRALFLKYLPTSHSMVATQSLVIAMDELKGVGAKLTEQEVTGLSEDLLKDQVPVSVQELMREGLRVKDFFARGLRGHHSIEGIFLFWSADALREQDLNNEFTIFSEHFFGFDLARRFDTINVRDVDTELYTRDYYFIHLEEEVARARRLQKAVAVIKLAFDRWPTEGSTEVNQSIMRTLASSIDKSSRVTDRVCRTGDNEISIILPHTARKGAAVRAERLRRLSEKISFQFVDRKLSISCGVSEYPSFCANTAELDQTSQQALHFIQKRGGNKVCLYRPPTAFKPDFHVPSI